MKFYFAGSIRGGDDDRALYEQIIALLQTHGEVLTEHIGDARKRANDSTQPEKYIFERDLAWLKEADVMVAEVTQPSLGVGYELGKAEEWHKPVLCLFRTTSGKKLSAMIAGNDYFSTKNYQSIEEVAELVSEYLSSVSVKQ